MAEVNAVGSGIQTAASDAVKKILGKDDFLKLLITQLKYQDPMEPTDNKDFVAQMAQFSSLEQMTNMSSSFEKLAGMQESTLREFSVGQAINLIGRTVSAVLPEAEIKGKINTESAKLYLEADSESSVIETLPKNTVVTVLGKEGTMLQVKLANGTNGYIDEASFTANDGASLVGVVTGMKIVDNLPNVIVNGKIIPLSYVEQVNLTSNPQAAGQTAGNS